MLTLETAHSWYPAQDPVHGFDHVVRVFHLAEQIGQAEGADLEIVRAAVLLHDADGGATLGGETGRSAHHEASASFARQILQAEGWSEDRIAAVEHCIRSHRFRDPSEQPQTVEAKVLFDADKLDAIGAIGAVRSIAFAVLADQPVYAEPSQRFRATGERELGEPHSSYHEFVFKLGKLKDRLFTSSGRKYAQDRHEYLEGFYRRLGQELRGEL